eukprot:GHVQ01040167.1.p1 GENE.GHVQ01040167.1~~GHVQ01040167.1.p1  ORF type:complete len:709 (+),score=152.34 GHVQ01040167.1:565-2691(+)
MMTVEEDCPSSHIGYTSSSMTTPPSVSSFSSSQSSSTNKNKMVPSSVSQTSSSLHLQSLPSPPPVPRPVCSHRPLSFSSLTDLVCASTGGKILFATDEWFSPARDLLSPDPPVFKEGLFTPFGKWMDGWETRRRRRGGFDYCVIQLGRPGVIRAVEVNTRFFTGNFAPYVTVQAAYCPGLEGAMDRYVCEERVSEDNKDEVEVQALRGNENIDRGKGEGERSHTNAKQVGETGEGMEVSGGGAVSGGEGQTKLQGQVMMREIRRKLGVIGTGISNDCRKWFESMMDQCDIRWEGILTQAEMHSGREDTAVNLFKIDTLLHKDHLQEGSLSVTNPSSTSPLSSGQRRPVDRFGRPIYTHIRLTMLPDGGIARLRLYGEVTALFGDTGQYVRSRRVGQRVPIADHNSSTSSGSTSSSSTNCSSTRRSSTSTPSSSRSGEIKTNSGEREGLQAGDEVGVTVVECNEYGEVDLCSNLNGGQCLCWSDEHYGRPKNLLLRERGRDMGSGWETARSLRRPMVLIEDPITQQITNFPPDVRDWTVIKLGAPGVIKRIEVDTEHFKGNYPESCEIDACDLTGLVEKERGGGGEAADSNRDIFWEMRLFSEEGWRQGRDKKEKPGGGREDRGRAENGGGSEQEEKRMRIEEQTERDRRTNTTGGVEWFKLVSRKKLSGDTVHVFDVDVASKRCTHVRLTIYPDGGVMRLRCWGSVYL